VLLPTPITIFTISYASFRQVVKWVEFLIFDFPDIITKFALNFLKSHAQFQLCNYIPHGHEQKWANGFF
jgi:hypothetical protein